MVREIREPSETVRTCGVESGPGGSQGRWSPGSLPLRAEAGGKTLSRFSQAHWVLSACQKFCSDKYFDNFLLIVFHHLAQN